MARFDPLSEDEIKQCLDAIPNMRWKVGTPVPNEYRTIFLALRWMGCHPAVLADPKKWGLVLREGKGQWVAIWKRPKKKNTPCKVPIPTKLVPDLETYMTRPHSRANIHRIVAWIGKEAGLDGLGPRTLRHTRACEIFRRHGARAAQDALGVDEATLAMYTALSSDKFVADERKAMELLDA